MEFNSFILLINKIIIVYYLCGPFTVHGEDFNRKKKPFIAQFFHTTFKRACYEYLTEQIILVRCT